MHPESFAKSWELMESIKRYRGAEYVGNRREWAACFSDLFQERGEVHLVSEALQHLVSFVIPHEPDRKVRDTLFEAIEYAGFYSQTADISLDPLVDLLVDDSDLNLLCWILILMARHGSYRHIEFVRRYLEHPNELVRKNARQAWECNLARLDEWSKGSE